MKKIEKEVIVKMLKYKTVTNVSEALNKSISSYNNNMNQLKKSNYLDETTAEEWYQYKKEMDIHFQKTMLESLNEAKNFYIELIKI